MMDSQLAALLMSDKIDQVVHKDEDFDMQESGAVPEASKSDSKSGSLYVKGYSHLSLSQPIAQRQGHGE